MSKANSQMIRQQIWARGVRDPCVLKAMLQVDRVAFVPENQMASAYEDRPIPLMPGATVSQPYIVALMTEILGVNREHKVLEIGTGSGYQAAVLSKLAREVWGVEVQPELVAYAEQRLAMLGLRNVHVVLGDGWKGLSAQAPFDRIIVTAAPGNMPQALIDQLRIGGRMVIPVGRGRVQDLKIVEKGPTGKVVVKFHSAVQFVPLVHLGETRTRK